MATRKDRFPRRTTAVGAWAVVVGALWLRAFAGLPGRTLGWWLIVAGLLTLTAVVVRTVERRGRSAAALGRWVRHSERHEGVASRLDLWNVASAWTLHRRAAVLRPHLADVGWWRRWRTPTTELATRVARVGWLGIWSSVEDITLRVGGPRTGKTGELACRIVDAPGAVVATSTRTDLVTLTGTSRARRGPVHVFNPSGIGGLASTIKFSPLLGCRNPRTAADRAADLIAAGTASGPGQRRPGVVGGAGPRRAHRAAARRRARRRGPAHRRPLDRRPERGTVARSAGTGPLTPGPRHA